MKDFPIILGDGLEIHQIQELVGSDNEFFNAYELRLNYATNESLAPI